MKHYHYRPEFNSRVYGPAEKRADKYWKKRREMMERGESMKRSCPYCGRIHDANYNCAAKPNKKLDTQANRFRATGAWHNKADEIKERDHYLDQADKAKGIYTYDHLEVHHIIPLHERFDLRLDNDNLITLSYQNHRKAERGEISREYLRSLIPPGV